MPQETRYGTPQGTGSGLRYPMPMYRWAAALQILGDAEERASVPGALAIAAAPVGDFVTDTEIATRNMISARVPKAERAATGQKISALAHEMRTTAMRTARVSGTEDAPTTTSPVLLAILATVGVVWLFS